MSEKRGPVTAATAPDRSCPAGGPAAYDSSSMPAIRPRRWSGIDCFHIASRKTPLHSSAPPATARNASATQTDGASPTIPIASPHEAAAIAMARPCRRTRGIQPLVAETRARPPTGRRTSARSTTGRAASTARNGSIAFG